MRVGAVFPQLEIGNHPADLVRYAKTVEDLGYDHLVIFDHVLGATRDRPGGDRFAYDQSSAFHEPLVLFGHLAAVTTRLGLATAVIVLPQRQTALVAKQAAQVDILSGGRLVLGVGIGWNFVEYEALGMRFTDRGQRIEEQIALMRELWTKDVVDLRGRWHRVDRAGLNPPPIQRPIPIWMGGGWDQRERKVVEAPLRRIAKIADGWFTHVPATDEGRAGMRRFQELVREAGRSPADVPVEGRVAAGAGDAAEWVRAADVFREMGCTHVEFTTMRAGYRSLDDHLRALARFREGLVAAGLAGR